ncbi:hypothetical protein PHYPO_G00110400 [Pangasianodon hypophthalmus]|uniref:Uncharacterized protein n=1 Tax=Pangasianodon hypophthalmus TaxID=310915 RepID=A0A5N5PZN4_PANHP|nr:hypothetical protein PHYPO_G00110400 [Pangasianodon hypophthalmus]
MRSCTPATHCACALCSRTRTEPLGVYYSAFVFIRGFKQQEVNLKRCLFAEAPDFRQQLLKLNIVSSST